jgi:hypothetical protein
LGDSEHIANTVALNEDAKALLEAGLSDLGLDFIQSEANYMMFDTGTDAAWVAAELASWGYQVRTGWGMPQHIRVSTGTMAEMQGFLDALQVILGHARASEHEVPAVFGLVQPRPNPFRSRCTIRVSTPGSERVTLTVHDTVGRKVRTLVSHPLSAGTHDIQWDGRDVRGDLAATGVYVVNLIQGEFAASARVTLSR